MAIAFKPEHSTLLANKAELRRLMTAQNAEMGVTLDPNATAERAQEMSLTLGIRPEENLLSRGIIPARDEA